MVREFTLINSKNESWDLNNRLTKVFLHEPKGLGFSRSETAVRYGNKQIFTEVQNEFPEVQGEICFFQKFNDDRYTEYDLFCRFISHEPLKLVYSVPGVNNFTLDCIVSSLEKTESEQYNAMLCPIVFKGLSFWKGDEIVVTGSAASYNLVNIGDFPVGMEIDIDGSPVNPDIQLSQDSQLYAEAKFTDTVAFSRVFINSNDGEQNIILEQSGDAVANPIGYQDLSISNGAVYITFIKIMSGESTLLISSDSGSLTSVSIKYTPLFRSV